MCLPDPAFSSNMQSPVLAIQIILKANVIFIVLAKQVSTSESKLL